MKTELEIVKKVMLVFKASDESKLTKFFEKQLKTFKEQVEQLEHNIKVINLKLAGAVAKLEDKLEDAREALEEAWLHVPEEALKNNASMDAYAIEYQNNIKLAEALVTALENELTKIKKQAEDNIKIEEEKLAKREAWIAKMME